jgi:hypothetical protein
MRSASEVKNTRGIDVGKSQHWRKRLCRRHFSIRGVIARKANELFARSRRPRGARCADSESQILATKKFSCLTASRRIFTRQSRTCGRIDGHRFGSRFSEQAIDFAAMDDRRASRAITRSDDDTTATILTRSDAELGLEQVVDGLRIGLAAGRLHDLADEPADELRLGFRLRYLVRIGGNDVVHHLFDRA